MKYSDLFEDSNVADLSMELRQNPSDDALVQQNGTERNSATRKPMITLRHINKLKRIQKSKMAEQEKRNELIKVMYANQTSEE